MSTNDTCKYTIVALDGNGNPSGDWEVGIGTYSGTNTLTRTTVEASSNSGSAVSLAAGNKQVFMDASAALLNSYLKNSNNLSDVSSASTARTNLAVPGTGTANTFSGLQTLSGGADLTPASSPSTTAVGYLGAPQNLQDATYTLVMGDAGKHLYHTSGSAHTWTIPSNASVAYPIGTILTFINASGAGAVTLAITSDTLRWGSSTGSRTLAANGVATAIKVTSTVWRLTGDGIS
jgi:hypothetical protein